MNAAYDNCIYLPCENHTCAKANSTCHRVSTFGSTTECRCNNGFVESGNKCIIDKNPCEINPCGANEKCIPNQEGGRLCVEKEEKVASNTGVNLFAAVFTPVAVIVIAVFLIVCLRRRHRRQMTFIEKEFECAMVAMNLDRTIDVRSVDPEILRTEADGRVMNLIYVSQDNIYEIPECILEPISRYELPPDSVRFHKMIGKGAFGRVYAGEANGINGNPEVTEVAIKTLKESANEEDLSNFLREIDLMKDLGGHENVINMYGCCTKCRPICLVLEYAPGGNLLNHLRALKKKCNDIVAARTDNVTNSKGYFQNARKLGKNPEDSESSLLLRKSHEKQEEDERIKQDEYTNAEISIRVKEEIRAALDSKELESFSHQIAVGMKHISDHGIVHRDLAARNILLGKNKTLKISDFGLSREGAYVQKSIGKIPFRWLAIEAIQERSYSTASDVWAFGVVLWEICTLGNMPYSAVSDRDLEKFLVSGKRLEKVENCTDDIYQIMSKCWSHLPKDRPTFKELSNTLGELRNTGRIYVNLDSLMEQSIKKEDQENSEEIDKDRSSDDESCDKAE
ncbi:tyrosine-protein kinase receptor torso-like [Dendronephthya gigantea]|uniref:tyrosine-protein kinase receptor torso-like n=1 Tax=Dendronephthya gigantea TaxID=151771 RepID=UPI00106AF596|nr:tyrosine-protein kinase receptor torso-like [Dendronephthya gigantea]